MQEEAGHVGSAGRGAARLRLFAALDVPASSAEVLAECARSIVPAGVRVRPIDQAALHLTFAFLGDVSEEHVPDVARRLDEAAADVPGPTLCTTSALASFGGGAVLGVEVDPELLAILDGVRDRFLLRVRPLAPQVDRRSWRPHISLVRMAPGGAAPIVGLQDRPPVPAVSWVARGLQLVASLPGPAGHQHRVLHDAPFGLCTACPRQ